jgi:hypothetical protein
MTDEASGTFDGVWRFQVIRSEERPDLLFLTLYVGDEVHRLALDKRVAQALGEGLSEIAEKLSPPRVEH